MNFTQQSYSHCPFCELVPSRVVYENDLALWVYDGFPISDGHSLIIPKRHVGSFFETTLEEKNSLMSLLEHASEVIKDKFKCDGFNIGINDGPSAGQTVPHLHIHLIPRYKGDQEDPRGGVRWIFPEKADYWSKNK